MTLDSSEIRQSHSHISQNDNEGTSVFSSFTWSVLRSLDSCFNYVLFGIPNELSQFSVRRSINDETSLNVPCDLIAAEDELKKFYAARDNLFRFSAVNMDSTSTTKRFCSSMIINESLHCKQEYNWDCGIACILMLVRFVKNFRRVDLSSDQTIQVSQKSSDNLVSPSLHLERLQKQWMCDVIQTSSIWTIDLIMLLDTILHNPPPRLRFPKCQTSNGLMSVKYLYCSNNFGVDESYQRFNYYKNAYRKDQNRVLKLFSEAQKKGIKMLNTSQIGIEHIADTVSKENCIAIALLDYGILGKDLAGNEEKKPLGASAIHQNEAEFSGHYVVLYGTSTNPNDIEMAQRRFSGKTNSSFCFIILDPGSNLPYTQITPELFEKAWTACGTDCDMIFLTVDNSIEE